MLGRGALLGPRGRSVAHPDWSERPAPHGSRTSCRAPYARWVDGVALFFVAALAIVAGALAAQAISRGRTIDRLRELTAAPDGVDVEQRVRQLQDETEAAQWEQGQVQRDLAYLADLVGVGIIHLTDDMRVDVANTAAHVFLGRPPGTLRDKTAMEAFVDARIEAVAETANQTGAATAEINLPERGNDTLTVCARRSPVRGI